MNSFTAISLIFAMFSVLLVMGLGIFSMVKGGEFNKKHSNKLMQLRVLFQGVALALLALAYYSSQS